MPQPSRYRRRTMWPFQGRPVNDPATFEAAPPPIERRLNRAEPARDLAAIESKLVMIEQEVEKWLGGRAPLVLRHVADLRKLL